MTKNSVMLHISGTIHHMTQFSPFDACDYTFTRQHTGHYFDAYKKKHAPLFFMTLIVWDIGTKKMKERTNTSNLIVDRFSLTNVYFSLACMLCFHVWLQNKGKFLVWREYYNRFCIYQPCHVSLLLPQQNTLSNPEAYSELCQTSKMVCFAK